MVGLAQMCWHLCLHLLCRPFDLVSPSSGRSIIKTMKQEYHEGPEAAQRFEKLATHLFRVPKSTPANRAKRVPGAPHLASEMWVCRHRT